MPNPKRRHSKKRGRLRRTHYVLKQASAFPNCPQCGKPKRPHRICTFCGYYKGEEKVNIVSIAEKKKIREKKRTKT